MKTTNCPSCNYQFDKHEEIKGEQTAPIEGDYTVCFNCGEILKFDKDIKPIIVQYDEIQLNGKMLATLIATQIEIKLRGKYYKK